MAMTESRMGSAPMPAEGSAPTRPFGAAAAVLIAAGIGSLVLGVLTTLAEMSEGIKERLTLSEPVGPLSGKTVFAVAAFLLSWAILHPALRQRDPSMRMVFTLTALLVGAGLLFTFPPFFTLFAGE